MGKPVHIPCKAV